MEHYETSKNKTITIVPPSTVYPFQSLRSEITTEGYTHDKPSLAFFSQTINNGIVAANGSVTVSLHSRLDKFFDSHPSWRLEVEFWLSPSPNYSTYEAHAGLVKPFISMKNEFDASVGDPQSRTLTLW